jgi:hypothetical protein
MGIMLQTDAHLHIGKLTAKERQEGEFLLRQIEGEIELCCWVLGDVPYNWLNMPAEGTEFDFGAN